MAINISQEQLLFVSMMNDEILAHYNPELKKLRDDIRNDRATLEIRHKLFGIVPFGRTVLDHNTSLNMIYRNPDNHKITLLDWILLIILLSTFILMFIKPSIWAFLTCLAVGIILRIRMKL
jgi:hypothetical protein